MLSQPDLVDVDVLLCGVVAVGHPMVAEDHHIDVSETFIHCKLPSFIGPPGTSDVTKQR